jgi:hypothetical protein
MITEDKEGGEGAREEEGGAELVPLDDSFSHFLHISRSIMKISELYLNR